MTYATMTHACSIYIQMCAHDTWCYIYREREKEREDMIPWSIMIYGCVIISLIYCNDLWLCMMMHDNGVRWCLVVYDDVSWCMMIIYGDDILSNNMMTCEEKCWHMITYADIWWHVIRYDDIMSKAICEAGWFSTLHPGLRMTYR